MAGITAQVFTGDFKQSTKPRGRSKAADTIYIEKTLVEVLRDSQARAFDGDYDAVKFIAKVRLAATNNDLSASVREAADGRVVVISVRKPRGDSDKVRALLAQYPEPKAVKAAPAKAATAATPKTVAKARRSAA